MILFAIPVTALLLAMAWVRWARRPGKPMDPVSQVEAYRRSVLALASHQPVAGRNARSDSAE